MKNQHRIPRIIWIAPLFVFVLFSCKDMFSSLKEFAKEETIYPASFDTVKGKIGFERIELDLSRLGRVPSAEMNLAKAGKTVIECSYFKEPLVIDSICSWVNITGLTEPEEYTFRIYTEDNEGNRSIPKEISLAPFTSHDLKQMELLSPKMTVSSSAAQLEWQSSLSGDAFDCYSYSYEYKDKDGVTQTGQNEGDIPSFIAENLLKEKAFPIDVTLKIVPKKANIPIIDTINWTSTIPLTIPSDANDAVFLKAPVSGHTIDLNIENGIDSYPFSWTKVPGVNAYTLKISSNANFNASNTTEFEVGDLNSFTLTNTQLKQFIKDGSAKLFWTVIPTNNASNIVNQVRPLTAYRAIRPHGMWLFNDINDPFKATIGNALKEVSLNPTNRIKTTTGPSSTDHAVFVPELSYLTCTHGIPVKAGDSYVNEYTLSMKIKVSSFKWFSIADIDELNNNGELFISPNGEVGIDGFWNTSTKNMTLNTWHELVYAINLDKSFKIYLDGQLVKTVAAGASYKNGKYALRPNLYLFRDDASWNNVNTVSIAEATVWGLALNDLEVAQMSDIKYR